MECLASDARSVKHKRNLNITDVVSCEYTVLSYGADAFIGNCPYSACRNNSRGADVINTHSI